MSDTNTAIATVETVNPTIPAKLETLETLNLLKSLLSRQFDVLNTQLRTLTKREHFDGLATLRLSAEFQYSNSFVNKLVSEPLKVRAERFKTHKILISTIDKIDDFAQNGEAPKSRKIHELNDAGLSAAYKSGEADSETQDFELIRTDWKLFRSFLGSGKSDDKSPRRFLDNAEGKYDMFCEYSRMVFGVEPKVGDEYTFTQTAQANPNPDRNDRSRESFTVTICQASGSGGLYAMIANTQARASVVTGKMVY